MIEVSATDVLRRSSPALKVAGIYGTAILLLFAAEIALARTLPSQAFGQYSLTRNALPLISALSLLGIDQAVTRRLAAGDSEFGVRRAFRQRIVLSVVMSLMGALITFWMTERVGPAITVAVSGTGLVISDYSAAVLRGRGSYGMSALIQQGYRLALGCILIALVVTGQVELGSSVAAIAVSVTLFAAIGAHRWLRRAKPLSRKRAGLSGLNRLGLAFGLSMIPFAALDWADQALLTQAAGAGVTGMYAVTKLVTVYPLLSLASIGGFLLMPEVVRRAETVTRGRVERWTLLMIGGSLTATIAWLAFAVVVIPPLLHQNPETSLLVVLCAVGGVRLFYLLPSSLLGALGDTQLIVRTSAIGLLSLLLLPIVSWALGHQGVSPELAVAVGLLAATATRVAISMVAVVRLTKRVEVSP